MSLWKFIFGLLRKYPWTFGVILVLSFMWAFEVLFWPYYIGEIVDIFGRYDADRSLAWSHLKILLMVGAVGWIFMDAGFRFRDFVLARILPKVEADIRMMMFDHVQHHSPRYFSEHFAGGLANKIGDMVSAVTVILRSTLVWFIPLAFTCALAIVIFSRIHLLLALVIAAWIVIHFWLCWAFTLKCAEYSRVHGESRSALVGKIVDSLTNNFVVNLFFRFRYEKAHIDSYQQDEKRTNLLAQIHPVKMFATLSVAFAVELFTLTGFLISYWLAGKISTGVVIQGLIAIWNLSMAVWLVADKAPELFQHLGISKQALSLMNDPQDVLDQPDAKELVVKEGEIVFDNVSFRYGKRKVFEKKNVRIKAGEKVGLVGYSGAGKSTFVNLILRFFPLEQGKILIDGQDISQVTLESLRNNIALIPQDPILFHRSLEENIRYGHIEASEQEILEAARLAHCDEFIRKCPHGYKTLVGERGTKLSGGEKQRIAIARASLHKAPILLLDEATSSLDSVTERYIQDSLNRLMTNRTTIVIAHRLSTLSKMNRILVFDQGQIIEEGSHSDLLNKNGHYARMWKMQAGGFLPDHPDIQG